MKGRYLLIAVAFLVIAAVLFVQVGDIQTAQAAAPAPICMDSLDEPTMSTIFLPYQLSPCGPPVAIPFYDDWVDSPHNDYESEAFRHWDEDDPPVIPASCAKCHSTPGYVEFLYEGENVDDIPVGSTVECVACHNDVTLTKTEVTFPSGITIEHLGDDSRCMECHQGRESGPDVDAEIADAGMTDDVDTVSTDLGFLNVHYNAAAATQYGGLVYGGYQYGSDITEEVKGDYDVNFRHVEEYDQCYECHEMHTLELKLDECADCHVDVETKDDLKDVRMLGSLADYDGDGDMEEGIYYEVDGLKMMLYDAIQQYGNQISVMPICYDSHAYPYWFNDTNASGMCDEGEANYGNRYQSWTARLLKAAYNYQVAAKDPGGYTHNGKYMIQLLHDSIYDLNDSGIEPGVDMVMADRIDPGHFAGSQESWRHWDEDDYEVSGSCSKCHSAEGIPFLEREGVSVTQEAANGMMCTTCHDPEDWPARWEFEEVEFPNGAEVSLEKDGSYDNNLCIQCHQGRADGTQLDDDSVGVGEDEVATGPRFRNIHYFSAGATLFGDVTHGIYQFEDMTYVGQNLHPFGSSMYATCTDCHAAHELEVEYQSCNGCHGVLTSPADLLDIRMGTTPDYDGDGNDTEGVYYEILEGGQADNVYAATQAYATAHPDADSICYESHSYPYWFKDTNSNGVCDPDEAVRANGYSTWTPRLARAAYNYQYAQKDPGGFAHNNKYVGQALYDNLADLDEYLNAGLTDGKTRPE